MTHEYDPQPAKDTAWQRLMINLGLRKTNARIERQQEAAAANRELRDQQAATRDAQRESGK